MELLHQSPPLGYSQSPVIARSSTSSPFAVPFVSIRFSQVAPPKRRTSSASSDGRRASSGQPWVARQVRSPRATSPFLRLPSGITIGVAVRRRWSVAAALTPICATVRRHQHRWSSNFAVNKFIGLFCDFV